MEVSSGMQYSAFLVQYGLIVKSHCATRINLRDKPS
jgi:hypothetical protein